MASLQTPEARSGSYLKYKADTNRCLSWLLGAAIACGYAVPSLSPYSSEPTQATDSQNTLTPSQTHGENLPMESGAENRKQKGKEKEKENTEPSSDAIPRKKRTIRTKEIVQQAKVVAESKTVFPQSISNAWESAISLRKRAAARFDSAPTSCEESNAKHRHFITLLENVLAILKRHESSSNVSTPIPRNAETVASSIPLVNRFEGLNVEDIEDDFEDLQVPSSPDPSGLPESTPVYDFQFEDSDDGYSYSDDRPFVVECFFLDCLDMRDFIQETWQMYKKGEIDGQTASFINSAAIALIRRQEEEIFEDFFPPGTKTSQTRMAAALYPEKSSVENDPPMESDPTMESDPAMESDPLSNKNPPQDHPNESAHPSESNPPFGNHCPYHGTHMGAWNGPPTRVIDFDEFIYWEPCSYLSECLSSCFKSGGEIQFAVPLLHRPLYPQSADELVKNSKKEDDQRFLTHVFQDLILAQQLKMLHAEVTEQVRAEHLNANPAISSQWATTTSRWASTRSPSMLIDDADAFSLGIDEYVSDFTKGIVYEAGTWLCFAAQSILDVRDVLGDEHFKDMHSQFEQKLQLAKECTEQKETSRQKVYYEAWLHTDSVFQLQGLLFGERNGEFEDLKKKMLTKYLDVDKLVTKLGPSWKEARESEKDRDWGTKKEFLKRRKERAILPTTDLTFLASIPLSCGLRILRLDLALEAAGKEQANCTGNAFALAHLYNASRQMGLLSTTWPEMERFISINIVALFSGEVPIDVAELLPRYRLKAKGRTSTKQPEMGPQLTDTKITMILRDFCTKGSEMNIHQCLSHLQRLFQPKSAKSDHRQLQMSPLELLKLLRSSLPAVIRDTQFDYWEFNRMCDDIMMRIRLTILCDLKIDHFKDAEALQNPLDEITPYTGHWKGGYFYMLSRIFMEIHLNNQAGRQSPSMTIVGKVFEKHIASLEKA